MTHRVRVALCAAHLFRWNKDVYTVPCGRTVFRVVLKSAAQVLDGIRKLHRHVQPGGPPHSSHSSHKCPVGGLADAVGRPSDRHARVWLICQMALPGEFSGYVDGYGDWHCLCVKGPDGTVVRAEGREYALTIHPASEGYNPLKDRGGLKLAPETAEIWSSLLSTGFHDEFCLELSDTPDDRARALTIARVLTESGVPTTSVVVWDDYCDRVLLTIADGQITSSEFCDACGACKKRPIHAGLDTCVECGVDARLESQIYEYTDG
jgi:hypothetical protein